MIKMRKCLKCDENFNSVDVGNRVCNGCRNENSIHALAIQIVGYNDRCEACTKINSSKEWVVFAGIKVCPDCIDDMKKWSWA